MEECQGIFEESRVFTEYTKELEGGSGYVIDTKLPGYVIADTMAAVYPVFTKEISEYVRSGKNVLKKHDLAGYLDNGEVILCEDEDALLDIFNDGTRESTPAKTG